MSEDNDNEQIVRTGSQALSKQSTALVRRGLCDLATLGVGRRKRVLVSHEEAVNEVVEKLLNSAGYDVKTTAHASEVLSLVGDFRPDLVLIQLVAPEIDGVKLSELLSTHFPRLKVVVLGPLYDDLGEYVRQKGVACAVLDLPCSTEELIEVVKTWVNRGPQKLSDIGTRQDIEPSSEKARVLVCDDEEALVEIIPAMLASAGYEVRSTLNSLEAIEIAREFQPHVAIIGEIMPRMHGFKVAERLMSFLPHTKIVLTAEAEPSDLEIFREQGWTYDILVCPFKKEELLLRTRAWVHEAMHPDHPRILIVDTEEAIHEILSEVLDRNGYIAIATGMKRKDGWPVQEIIEEAKIFRPHFIFLFSNLHMWPKWTGTDIALLLIKGFPDTKFLVAKIGSSFTVSEEALQYAQNHGCQFQTLVIPFELDDLLQKLTAWNGGRTPSF